MNSPQIVVDDLSVWESFEAGASVLPAGVYLTRETPHPSKRVINLCSDTDYLGTGYYVSLLAEARGSRPLPSVRTLLELSQSKGGMERLRVRRINGGKAPAEVYPDQFVIYFGECEDPRLSTLAHTIFQRFPAPVLNVTLGTSDDYLFAETIELVGLSNLEDEAQSLLGNALDRFNRRVWKDQHSRNMKYDLAILVDHNEEMPPSSKTTIKLFEQAARSVGFAPEIITEIDRPRLLEFDALFIRTTTSINHYTYQMARQAAREGMAVIDDPDSILRCCNKVFLHDLMRQHHIAMPKSRLILRDPSTDYESIVEDLNLPMVLKIPDGAFSKGVFKVETLEDLVARCKELLTSTAVIIAQAFVPTTYDWRVGVLEGRPLYVCHYHMAPNHWQIINHDSKLKRYGEGECVPLSKVPSKVIRTALKAARLIGNGLYGVDVKEVEGQALVIEVNDNPNIDHKIEDQMLGHELYRQVMTHLINEVQARGHN